MPTSRKEAQRQTRERLLAAASASIVQEGITATSIRSICSAAGLTQGAFYSNFASKDDLLVDVMETHIRAETAILRDLVVRADHGSIEKTLAALVGRLADLAVEPRWSLLSIELQLHAQRDPGFAARYKASKEACHQVFAELVGELVDRHHLTPALPPFQLGIGLYALWSGLAVQGDVDGALPRDQMLLAFFRAMTGSQAP